MSSYDPVPLTPARYAGTDTIRLNKSIPMSSRRLSLSSESDESDIVYRDALDVEPFDEKDRRFKDEGIMEDGADGYEVEPRRVRYPHELIGATG
jgi:hypothetical protein